MSDNHDLIWRGEAVPLRTRCRNPHCLGKLPEPVGNPHAAFCTPGCWRAFHRHRCIVCEGELKRSARDGRKLRCGRRKCKNEQVQWPHVYLPFGAPDVPKCHPSTTKARKARKSCFEMPHCLRSWVWQKLPGEDEDYELLNAEGKMVARVRQEGEQWCVARPRCIPEPPLESLDAARKRAIGLALAALPNPLRDQNRQIIREVLRERELYPWRFSDAGERYARGELGAVQQWEPAAPQHSAEMPDIPDFLRRAPIARAAPNPEQEAG